MGNSSTASRSSARGKANQYQRSKPPQKQHHPPRQGSGQANRGNQFQPSSPSRISPNLNKRHRRLPSQQQQQLLQQGSDADPPPAKRRRVNNSASETMAWPQQPTDASSVRPPAKVSVTQPQSPMQRTTNGVRTTLQSGHDHLGQESSTGSMANDDKRVLRSQGGGPRSTSDLVQFFPDYEEFVFGDSNKRDLLHVSSSLYVTDDKKHPQTLPIRTAGHPPEDAKPVTPLQEVPTLGPRNGTSDTDAALDLTAFDKEALDFKKDPLPDSEFIKAHKRGERNEKQMRNVEKERAMHEKFELERLYDELRGPDWLKAMGISGITESEKKQYEPKRDHYKAKVFSLLMKFEKWKDKEKEMKVKKERALAARAESDGDDDEEIISNSLLERLKAEEDNDGHKSTTNNDEQPGRRKPRSTRKTPAAAESNTDPDPQAKPQKPKQAKKQDSKKEKATAYDPELEKWQAEQEITSFYAKPHEREAALGKHRRGKRHVTAFGHPLPRMDEEEFGLPEDFLTADEMRDFARKRRRDRREELRK